MEDRGHARALNTLPSAADGAPGRTLWSAQDREWIKERAVADGFALCGLAAVAPSADGASPTMAETTFARWVADGHAGEMEYLKRTDLSGNLIRGDVRRSLPWARSVLVCALDYNVAAPYSIDPAPAATGWIARYAWSGGPAVAASGVAGVPSAADYHDVLLPRLEALAATLRERFGAGCQTRSYVDTGPILERDYAARAGVGWIGRNTCVIHQQRGSWLLLGVIVTSLLPEAAALELPAPDRCGSCTRCIDACPTNALPLPAGPDAARTMDASRCIAYLTIEHKGSIAEELRAPMGRQVFGCDICQEVCPWNRPGRAGSPRDEAALERSPLPPRRALINPSLGWLASLDGPSFNRWFRGSPLERTRRRRVLRNVAIAMGNSGDRGCLPPLEALAAGDDPVLAETARWAIDRLHGVAGQPSAAQATA